MKYQDINSQTIDRWVEEGWEWGRPIGNDEFERAKHGSWDVKLTPCKFVPHEWFGDLSGKEVLGLASGGGQQIPVFSALGARCTVLDYSEKQLESERLVAAREGYDVELVRADMTKPLPFESGRFDLIFHPVSNCYVREVEPIWAECFRVLKPRGVLIAGMDNSINYLFADDNETVVANSLPFDPLNNPEQMRQLCESDSGVQFSHSLEEQIGGQLKAGFRLTDIYDDINDSGRLHDLNIPCFFATRAVAEK
ncbi:MAG: class I SAM-dependent methyltransferase [Eubacterium sp.]|jgi:SAM-dependent methyltransferase